jgi:4-carboxymuconolactone decarboxylase
MVPTQQDKLEFLNGIVRARGYAHRSHRLLANHDLDVLRAMNPVPMATYADPRTLTPGEKELLLIPAFTCLRSPQYIIEVHIKKALSLGVPAREILEAIELLIREAGRTIFQSALAAYAACITDIEDSSQEKNMAVSDEAQSLNPHRDILRRHDEKILDVIAALDSAVYGKQRALSASMKELLTVVILTTLKAPAESIRTHMCQALAAGATEQQLLEAIELIITPAGLPIFEHGLTVWADVTDAKPLDPSEEAFSRAR